MESLTFEEIDIMREVCRLAADTIEYVEPFIKPGISTNEINQIVYDYTLKQDAVPAPLNYNGFPKSICTSLNHVICHGVPGDEILKDGDIINVDITTYKNGFYGDVSKTFFIGDVSNEARDLSDCAYNAMLKGIQAIKPNATVGDIGFAINKFVTKRGYYVVKELGGHGIGKKFHTEPFIPSFGKKGKGSILTPWTCITVEPMINQTNTVNIEIEIPNSSIKIFETKDKCLSAQFEHTVLITDTGYEILTKK